MSLAPRRRLPRFRSGTRVVLVLASSTGGIGRHVRSLAGGLVDAGLTVTVAGPAATEPVFRFADAGAAFVALEIPASPGPRDATAVLRARSVVRDAALVHAHGLRAGLVVGVALGKPRRPRPPLVVTWHNAVLATGLRGRVLAVLERRVARMADVTLGASQDLVDRARRLGAADARLGEVSAPPLPEPVADRAATRAALGAVGRPLVLAVGRLHPQKGYPVLLDAARRWASRSPRPLVAIAGDGPEHDALARRIAGERLDVTLLGRRDDVADLMAAADLVVLPSTWEARALVAQEALRAGVPLVASAVGGVPALVGDAAVLVPPGDSRALADAVDDLLDDPALAQEYAARGVLRASGWPDEVDTTAQVAALYEDLLRAAS